MRRGCNLLEHVAVWCLGVGLGCCYVTCPLRRQERIYSAKPTLLCRGDPFLHHVMIDNVTAHITASAQLGACPFQSLYFDGQWDN
jgi:hypothetical protein